MASRLIIAYALGGLVAAVWWYVSTENTGSSRRERAIDALVVGIVWLPALAVLYGLRGIAWARRQL